MKIISGGQTGADGAALDWALKHGIPHGGWCPKGRWAEDGPIAQKYQLRETASAEPGQRTEWNVRDSDGTVIFSIKPQLSGGALLTAQLAGAYGKPCLRIWRGMTATSGKGNSVPQDPVSALVSFIKQHRIQTLNIAGPRASEEPEVGEFVSRVLEGAYEILRNTAV